MFLNEQGSKTVFIAVNDEWRCFMFHNRIFRRCFLNLIFTILLFALWGCEDAMMNQSPPEQEDDFYSEFGPDVVFEPGLYRLSSDPRTAIQLEAFYALNRSYGGGSTKSINGWTISDWNYVTGDINAYNVMKSWHGPCSSMWKGPHANDPKPNSVCAPYKNMGDNCFYDHVQNYGIFGSYGRGGQCYFFANLILFRSGTYSSKLPSYSTARSDYAKSDSQRTITKDVSKSYVGDVLMTKSNLGTHTAIVVAILEGTSGSSVTKIDVVDANLITWGGADEEIIARHILDKPGSWGSYTDIDNYFALKLNYR